MFSGYILDEWINLGRVLGELWGDAVEISVNVEETSPTRN